MSSALIPHPVPADGDVHTPGPAAPSVCTGSPPHCPHRTRLYRGGRLVAEGFHAEQISVHLDAHPDAVIWLDLLDPEPADLKVITEEFGLHPLAVEDAVHDHQRPKLDRYDSHLFTSMYAVGFDPVTGQVSTGEVNAFITARALVTVRKTHFDVDTLLARWDGDQGLAATGVEAQVHGLLDSVADGHLHAVAQLTDAIDDLEDALFDPRPGLDIHRRGFQLRKAQVRLRRVIEPMRDLVADLERGGAGAELVARELAPYFKDVHDHVVRAAEGVEAARELLASVLDANYTEQSTQLNEITKKLAAWAAIIAVPTAVTGWYGQNVPYPGFNQDWGFVVGTAVIVVLAGGLWWALRRRGWL